MSTYSLDPAVRKNERNLIRARALAEAERVIKVRGRSMKCGRDDWGPARHAGEEDGCKNDGTGCICECHDGEPAGVLGWAVTGRAQ